MKRGLIFVLISLCCISLVSGLDTGCCEETYSDTFCINGMIESGCKSGYHFGQTCENFAVCDVGCCIEADGACGVNGSEMACTSESGIFYPGSCESVSDCTVGCCIMGSEYDLVGYAECLHEYEPYSIEPEFFASDDTTECASYVGSNNLGCCVQENEICKYDSADMCSYEGIDTSTGYGFYEDQLCSDVSDYLDVNSLEALTYCECESGDEEYYCDYITNELYVQDSCGNGGEYVKTCPNDMLCSAQFGDCISGACDSTFSFPEDSVFADFNFYDTYYVDTDGAWKSITVNLGDPRINYESWCVYEGPVGSFADRPGTQHYLGSCINGVENLESCDQAREEICVNAYNPEQMRFEAECMPNNFGDYYNVDYHTGSAEPSIYAGYYGQPIVEGGVSTVPVAGNSSCDYADFTCEVVYGDALEGGNGLGWEPYVNSVCLRKEFALTAAEYCSSRGDCGLDVNILGKRTGGGFSINPSVDHVKDATVGCGDGNLGSGGCFNQDAHYGGFYPFVDAAQCADLSGCNFYGVGYIKDTYFNHLEDLSGLVSIYLGEFMLPYWFPISKVNTFAPYPGFNDMDCMGNKNRVRSFARNGLGSNLPTGDSLSGVMNYCNSGFDDESLILECENNAFIETAGYLDCSAHTMQRCRTWDNDSGCDVPVPVADGFDLNENGEIPYDSFETAYYMSPIYWDYSSAKYVQDVFRADSLEGEYLHQTTYDNLKEDGHKGNPDTTSIYDQCCYNPPGPELDFDQTYFSREECARHYDSVYELCMAQVTESCSEVSKGQILYDQYNSFASIKPWVLGESALLSYTNSYNAGDTDWVLNEDWYISILEGHLTSCSGEQEFKRSWNDGDIQNVKIDYACDAFQGPAGGDDCHLCDTLVEDGGLIYTLNGEVVEASLCNRFRCESLGSTCTFIDGNQHAALVDPTRPSCVDSYCTATTEPVVTINDEFLKDEGSYEYLTAQDTGGYTLSDLPWGEVPFGVYTPGQMTECKFVKEEAIAALQTTYNTYDINTIIDQHYEDFNAFYESLSGAGVYISPGEGMVQYHNFSDVIHDTGEVINYYVWCKNVCGAVNLDYYDITLEAGVMPPSSFALSTITTDPVSGLFYPADTTGVELDVYMKQEAQCRYSYESVEGYDDMTEEFNFCDEFGAGVSVLGSHYCSTIMPLESGTNLFYISCMDSWGNELEGIKEWSATKTDPLEITYTAPSGTLYYNDVELQVNTDLGYSGTGAATCSYRRDAYSFEQFVNTESSTHTQPGLVLGTGYHEYDVECVDVAGNTAETEICFTIAVDSDAPKIDNVYYLGSTVYVITNEEAMCEYYDSSFTFGNGVVMAGTSSTAHSFTVSDANIYYIQCMDEFANVGDEMIIGLEF